MRIVLMQVLMLLLIHASKGNQLPQSATEPLSSFQITSLSTLGKVWGFLKYYHPGVAKGQYNWDSVLIAKIPSFIAAGNSKAVNDIVSNWLSELKPVNNCPTCDNDTTNKVFWNLDTSWMETSGFSPGIITQLKYIQYNRHQGNNYYFTYSPGPVIKILNEKPYNTDEYQFPSASYRLLTLFRYWNIVNYFSPYKYITTKKWPAVLNEFIPLFYNAADTLQYQVCILKMIGSLNDGHSAITWSPTLANFFGKYNHTAFHCSIIEGKAVVTSIFNEALCKEQGIALNDIIISIDGETIEERIKKYSPYIHNASNEAAAGESLSFEYLFAGNDTLCRIVKLTPTQTQQLIIKRYEKYPPMTEPPIKAWKILDGNIGYVNMGDLWPKDAQTMMDSLANTKGIIFDVRNYPRNAWIITAVRLSCNKFQMCRMTCADNNYPGVFKYLPSHSWGSDNTRCYKGKVVILVNAYSKSHAEYSIMGLQAATKTITIGSTTAGADGNITEWIALPGGFRTRFSGLGIYYPDGTVAQRKGVKIDIVCKPTIKGIMAGKDELVETAVKTINNGQ